MKKAGVGFSSTVLTRHLSLALQRDLLAGAGGGLFGGLVLGWALQTQGMMADVAGLVGLTSSRVGLALFLAIGSLVGASFGALFRYQPQAYAATIAAGMLYGLLWWIAGPLTLMALLKGDSPTWSLAETNHAFPDLIGYLLYGGLTGLGFHVLVTFYQKGKPESEPTAVRAPPVRRVVILGGGFGGLAAAQRLEQIFDRDPGLEITLVSQSNYLLFTPMLAEVAASGLEAQHISAPVRAACPHTRFYHADVQAIDTVTQAVRIRASVSAPAVELRYDQLVLALGSVPTFHGLPGVEEYAFTLKTLQDATRLRNHVIASLEEADVEPHPQTRSALLTFAVAGGGFAGVEMIAEICDLARSVRRYYPGVRQSELRFVLVHSGDRILPELSAELGEYAQRKLQARGIEFLLGKRVAGATANALQLNDGGVVFTRTVVWTAGNEPNPILRGLPVRHSRSGQVLAESTLQVSDLPNVWAVGDCAQIPDAYNEGKFCPPTAQHALREGKVAADNVAAMLRGEPPSPFRFRAIGTLVALGHRTAAAEIRGRQFSGLLAWLLWRTIYLSKLPGLEKKVRVALDWTLDLMFPRDIVLTANNDTPTLREMIGIVHGPDRTPVLPKDGSSEETRP